MNVRRREIVACVIFSIITCGIYALYWMSSITNDLNYMLDERDTSGGTCVLLSIITCGIYSIYWAYKIGQKITKLKLRSAEGYVDSNLSVLYLILSLFGFSIIVYVLSQIEINKFSTM